MAWTCGSSCPSPAAASTSPLPTRSRTIISAWILAVSLAVITFLTGKDFEADVDMTIQIEGARMSRNLFKAAPLKNLVSGENQPAAAVPDNKDGGSDDDWEKWIQDEYMTVNHPSE